MLVGVGFCGRGDRSKEVSPLSISKNRGMRALLRAPWGLQGSRTGVESMSPFVPPTIVAVSAIVAVGSLLVSLHASRRSDRDSAREEALALAETRRQIIDELRADLEQTRVAARHTLIVLRRQLEDSPPDVDGALRRIRSLLEHESVPPR